MEHHAEECPNCGRTLHQDEMFCWFCEMDLSELRKKHAKKGKHKEH